VDLGHLGRGNLAENVLFVDMNTSSRKPPPLHVITSS